MNRALEYARATGADRIVFSGYRGATLLSDGSVLTEKADIAEIRAREMQRLFEEAGFRGRFDVDWTDVTADPDGVDDWRSRRTDIRVEP